MAAARRLVVSIPVAALAFLAAAPAQSTAQRDFVEVPGQMEFSGRMIARPVQIADWQKQGRTAEAAAAQHRAAADFARTLDVIEFVRETDEYVFTLPRGEDENQVARRLMATGLFQYVEPDWILYPVGCPNDQFFAQQWHHGATKLQSCQAWDYQTGFPGVGVGICDTGLEITHPDLRINRRDGYNATSQLFESQGGVITPVASHGTQTTGCAAANGRNTTGVVGIGWNLGHRMLRVSENASGSSSSVVLNRAARKAIESGDKVASVSYSGVKTASNLISATYVKSIGGLLVWAAGNVPVNLTGNRVDDDIVCVGGTDILDQKYVSSGFGPFVDLVAPAVNVFMTTTGASYTTDTGTSYATPMVAGLAALIWAADPTLTPDEVEVILRQCCDDIGAPGVDNQFGFGRINAYKAMQIVAERCSGTYLRYGNGLRGVGNYTPDLNVSGCPREGNTISFEVAAARGGTSGFLLLGTAQISVPLFGGTLLVSPTLSLPRVMTGTAGAPGGGTDSLLLSLPVGTAGVTLCLQGLYLDAGAVQGFSFSQGLTITIGS
jgi:subtilisin family serine protease